MVIKKAYFDAPDGQIHYRYLISSQAAKKKPCIFLHMSASSGGQFSKLMDIYAARGHDCYAPDMPGFGGSYNAKEQPANTGYYVSVFMALFHSLSLTNFHIVGHHSGASLAVEMAALYPSHVASLCLIGFALMTPADQAELGARVNKPFNKPVADGSHLAKTWTYLQGCGDDLEFKHQELMNNIRAWQGRLFIDTCVFKQDIWNLFAKVQCPILNLCAKDDVLWPYLHYVNEIKPDVRCVEVKGENYEPWHDSEGIAKVYTEFLEKSGD